MVERQRSPESTLPLDGGYLLSEGRREIRLVDELAEGGRRIGGGVCVCVCVYRWDCVRQGYVDEASFFTRNQPTIKRTALVLFFGRLVTLKESYWMYFSTRR